MLFSIYMDFTWSFTMPLPCHLTVSLRKCFERNCPIIPLLQSSIHSEGRNTHSLDSDSKDLFLNPPTFRTLLSYRQYPKPHPLHLLPLLNANVIEIHRHTVLQHLPIVQAILSIAVHSTYTQFPFRIWLSILVILLGSQLVQPSHHLFSYTHIVRQPLIPIRTPVLLSMSREVFAIRRLSKHISRLRLQQLNNIERQFHWYYVSFYI